jgi:hypothetical protein
MSASEELGIPYPYCAVCYSTSFFCLIAWFVLLYEFLTPLSFIFASPISLRMEARDNACFKGSMLLLS